MNWFTISPFHHSVCVSFQHFTISVHFSYTISLNKLSRHLTHYLYKYYILTNHLSNYSESDESGANRSSHKYTKASRKYETSLHITPYLLDNLPNINSSRPNIYAVSKKFKEFGGFKAVISENYCSVGRFCLYAFNHGYGVCFRKILDRLQSFMRCTFRCHKMCVGEIFTKFMHMLQRYLCNKCCIILGRGGGFK